MDGSIRDGAVKRPIWSKSDPSAADPDDRNPVASKVRGPAVKKSMLVNQQASAFRCVFISFRSPFLKKERKLGTRWRPPRPPRHVPSRRRGRRRRRCTDSVTGPTHDHSPPSNKKEKEKQSDEVRSGWNPDPVRTGTRGSEALKRGWPALQRPPGGVDPASGDGIFPRVRFTCPWSPTLSGPACWKSLQMLTSPPDRDAIIKYGV
ncbi:hypothetical protein H6P81_003112 [Aristolochia fimbriata]|uniref:Uncharacterized protein n=1 Tax=Aristolochia fimbriata TaxID=158543 RepID=A0AAV7FDH2_ARIFI|nr:hypothetical protein H6P81_003112 [Aristolochia fimbriata]